MIVKHLNLGSATKHFTLSLGIAALTLVAAQSAIAGTTTVTDAIGTQEIWTYNENLGIERLTSRINQSDGKGITQTFDANNNRLSRTDAEGRTTTYTYNATNQKISMTEASGTSEARTTNYTYVSPDIDLVVTKTSPSVYTGSNKTVTNTYDTDLNITQITVNGFTQTGAAVNRTATFQYNSRGQITQIDGPRTDISDITTFAYYTCSTGSHCGQLASSTNAAGHIISYDSYDANARITQMTDALGVVTSYTYHPRGWLLSITRTPPQGAARTTSYQYDAVGQLTQTTLPDGIVLSHTYDEAHDLRSISDNLGNLVEYTYDAKGNRTNTQTRDPDNTLVRELTTQYDIRNFITSINAAGSITQQVNDAVGNNTQTTDPNQNPSTDHSYDPLDRLTSTLDALSNTSSYSYNVADQLIQVTAPNGAVTSFQFDDLNNQLQESSPDRGVTTYVYDDAGNRTNHTDARGITANITYDELNRPTLITYPDPAETITFTYDVCTHNDNTDSAYSTGRLCQVNDQSGITTYDYDPWGNITRTVKQEIDNTTTIGTYTTLYSYDNADRVTSTSYPTSRTVDYQRDAIGRIIQITTTAPDNTTSTILNNRAYRADGLWTSQSLADTNNTINQSKTYDLQGRLTQHTASTYSRNYQYDANGNIIDFQGSLDRTYQYDALDRVIEELGAELGVAFDTIRAFSYDANGNRLNEAVTPGTGSTQNTAYQYDTNSNRINQINSTGYTIDASGRVTTDEQGRSYTYNNAGRLMRIENGSTVLGEYTYNANQLRTRKVAAGQTTIFHYDTLGNLIAESDGAGVVTRAYIYADGQRIAMLAGEEAIQAPNTLPTNVMLEPTPGTTPPNPSVAARMMPILYLLLIDDGSNGGGNPPLAGMTTYYYINDHLNTPQRLLDENQQIAWQAEYQAFGYASLIVSTVEQPHRFPGQYFDAETELHYNWHRYYEPRTGRYITSDPIGLDGGVNTFGYSYSNPLSYYDPDGKFAIPLLPLIPLGILCYLAGPCNPNAPPSYNSPSYGPNPFLTPANESDGICDDLNLPKPEIAGPFSPVTFGSPPPNGDDPEEPKRGTNSPLLNSGDADRILRSNGYRPVNGLTSGGNRVYYNPKGNPKYMVRSNTSHNGDAFKGFSSQTNVRNGKRSGSYDPELNYIKP